MAHSSPSKLKQSSRLERHSAGAPGTQAYGRLPAKRGAGKFNWGRTKQEEESCSGVAVDARDPMFDSDGEAGLRGGVRRPSGGD
ncbi:hypothetical protein Efla_004682 [Eimeria flavescens]